MTEALNPRRYGTKPGNPENMGSPVEGVRIEKIIYEMPGGEKTRVFVLRASPLTQPNVVMQLAIDRRFSERPIQFEGTRLIDQKGTKESKEWHGETVGIKPEETLRADTPALAFPCNHYGWQSGSFLIENGKTVLLKNDQDSLNGQFTVIGSQDGRWKAESVTIINGKPIGEDEDKIKKMNVGFSMPLMVENGKEVPLQDTISDARYLADLRNVFDFSAGERMDRNFWLLIRPLLPENAEDALKLLQGELITTYSRKLSQEQVSRLAAAISEKGEESAINRKLKVDYLDDGRARLTIKDGLPFNRIPLIGVGFQSVEDQVSGEEHENELVVVVIDGRQEDSVGADQNEAREIMGDYMETGGFGPAGGDVSLVDNAGKIYNIPCTEDKKTRPHPVQLTIFNQ